MTSRSELQQRSSHGAKSVDDRMYRFKERYANFVDEANEIRDELIDRMHTAVEFAVQNKRTSCSVFFTPNLWSFPVQMLLYGPSKQRDPAHFIGVDFLNALGVRPIDDVIQAEFPGVTVTPLGLRVKISWKDE